MVAAYPGKESYTRLLLALYRSILSDLHGHSWIKGNALSELDSVKCKGKEIRKAEFQCCGLPGPGNGDQRDS